MFLIICTPIKSVQELLANYDYLYDVSSGKLRSYKKGDSYPKNAFLDNLNLPYNTIKLNDVSVTNIVGKLDKNETISQIKVGKPSIDGNSPWANGQPDSGGLVNGEGDGTVPRVSAESISSDEQIEINSSHMQLPGKAENEVYQAITGNLPQKPAPFVWTKNNLFFFALSPIDLQVIVPDKIHWAGKNIKGLSESDKIDGAYYTGYAGVENEFLTVPDPQDGEYKIITQGTGEGKYTVKVSEISEDENGTGQAKESAADDITGTAVKDKVEESQVTVSGDTVTAGVRDTTPPTITASVTPKSNDNGWNNTDVMVHFDATDESGIKAGAVTPDVTLSSEGKDQSVTGEAEDSTGNAANKTISGINIDKTAPITTSEISGTKGNGDWYISPVTINLSATDNLSGIDQTFYTVDGSNLQNGNSITLSTDGKHAVRYYSQDLAGNSETEKTVEINIDQTGPKIAITSPKNGSYKNNETPEVKYVITDNLSGVDESQTSVTFDGQNYAKNKIDLSLEHLGLHTVKVNAIDAAGNHSQVQVDFTLTTSIDSISQNVRHYFSLGLISKLSTELFLEVKLRNIQEMMNLLNTFQSKWMPQWAKSRVIENLRQNINREIDGLENQIQRDKNFSRTIDSKIQAILLEDLEGVKV